MLTIYGIKNCNTMKKAFDFLNQTGIEYQFFDYKKAVLSQEDVQRFFALFGEKTINRQGTTYRNMDADTKTLLAKDDLTAIYEVIKNNQSVLKRPIVIGENVALIGFDEQEWVEALAKS